MTMALPRTPNRSGQELYHLIESLNEQFALDLPNPHVYSPSVEKRNDPSLRWRSYEGLKRLYYCREVDLNRVINSFEEWLAGQRPFQCVGQEYRSRNGHLSRQQMAGLNRRGSAVITQED